MNEAGLLIVIDKETRGFHCMTEPSIMSVVHYGFVAALHQEFYQRVEVKMGTILCLKDK